MKVKIEDILLVLFCAFLGYYIMIGYKSEINIEGIDCYEYNNFNKILKSHVLPDFTKQPTRFENNKLDGICISSSGVIGSENNNKCNKSGKTWCEVQVPEVDLSGDEIILSQAKLNGANLANVNFAGNDMHDIDLENANLTDANLNGSFLFRANLKNANLKGANLENTNFMYANLRNVNRDDNIMSTIICNSGTKFDTKYSKQINDCGKSLDENTTQF